MTPIDFGQFNTDHLRLIAPEVGHVFKRREKRARNTFVALFAHLTGEEGGTPVVQYMFFKLGGSTSGSERVVFPHQIHPAAGGDWQFQRISAESNRKWWTLEWDFRHEAKRRQQVMQHLINDGSQWHAIDTRAAKELGNISPGWMSERGNLYL